MLSGAIADEDLPEDSVSVLLPFVDMLNHRPLAKVEWHAGEKDVFFLTLEDVATGQEIANNYGPRNNEQRKYSWLSYAADTDLSSDDELRLLSCQQHMRLSNCQSESAAR